jgi:hypothetical protein
MGKFIDRILAGFKKVAVESSVEETIRGTHHEDEILVDGFSPCL